MQLEREFACAEQTSIGIALVHERVCILRWFGTPAHGRRHLRIHMFEADLAVPCILISTLCSTFCCPSMVLVCQVCRRRCHPKKGCVASAMICARLLLMALPPLMSVCISLSRFCGFRLLLLSHGFRYRHVSFGVCADLIFMRFAALGAPPIVQFTRAFVRHIIVSPLREYNWCPEWVNRPRCNDSCISISSLFARHPSN